jgi:tyrosine-protein kinase Etk/Wzc
MARLVEQREISVSSTSEQEIDFYDALIVLAKHKRMITGVTVIAAVVAGIVSLLLPSIYVANTRILPPQQNESTAMAMLSQLSPLVSLAGNNLGLKNPNDVYVAMLTSRTLAESMIRRFGLQQLYDAKMMVDARRALEKRTNITVAKDGTINIEMEDRSPQRAAELANGYVDDLRQLSQKLAVTQAAQRRLFLEGQLNQTKEQLANAEVALKKVQETTGLIQPDNQGRVIIESVARMQAQIAAKEVQLTSMRSFATEQNPDLLRTEQEVAGLRVQLAKLEKDKAGNGNIQVATKQVPEAALEYVRRLRDVKYYETMFEALAKQYELARFDEAKEAAIIQVLDKAVPPERRARPRRTLIVLISLVAAALLACVAAFVMEAQERANADPEHAAKLQLLKQYLRGPRSELLRNRE